MLADIPHVIPSLTDQGQGRTRLGFRLLGWLYGLVMLEIFLRIFSPFPMVTGPTAVRPDDVLGYIMDSRFPDIDPDGFRNGKDGLAQADIVTMGDSMTYGYNAGMTDNWPSQLGSMTGRTVYNYGIGGYGPLQYSVLLDRALAEKKPKVVVVGLNPAYELADFCELLTTKAYWQGWASERGLDISDCASAQPSGGPMDSSGARVAPMEVGVMDEIKSLVKETAIGGAIGQHAITSYRDWRERNPGPDGVLFKDGRNDTIVSEGYTAYTLRTTNLARADQRLSLRIARLVMEEMAETTRRHNVTMIIALMPTRQAVVRDYLERRGVVLPPSFLEAIEREKMLAAAMVEPAIAVGAKVADPRAPMSELMETQRNVYPFRDDGHPLAIGYKTIASTVADAIR